MIDRYGAGAEIVLAEVISRDSTSSDTKAQCTNTTKLMKTPIIYTYNIMMIRQSRMSGAIVQWIDRSRQRAVAIRSSGLASKADNQSPASEQESKVNRHIYFGRAV